MTVVHRVKHRLPTKEESWQAWAYGKADRHEPIDREEFERWWRCEEVDRGTVLSPEQTMKEQVRDVLVLLFGGENGR